MTVRNTVSIVTIVAIVLLVIILFVVVVCLTTNNAKLSLAESQLETALNQLGLSVQQFTAALVANLQRFLGKLRDTFVTLLNGLTIAVSQSVTFLTNVITKSFQYVEHLTFQIAQEYTAISTQISTVVEVYLLQIQGKIAAMPIQIVNDIILGFTKIVTGAFHTVFCWAVNGLQEIQQAVTADVVSPIIAFLSGNNPIITTLENFITQNVAIPVYETFSDVQQLPAQFASLLISNLSSLGSIVNSIRCAIGVVCHALPGTSCPSNPGDIFGSTTIIGVTYSACF